VLSPEPDLLVEGPLAGFVGGYEQELRRLGYHGRHVCRHVAVASELSKWMQHRGLGVEQLRSELLEMFFADRRQRGCSFLVTTRCVAALVAWLAEAGVTLSVPVPAPGSIDELLVHYREYLVHQRGLTAGTVGGYERVARLFSSAVAADVVGLAALTAADVNGFVVEFCARPVKVSPREMVSSLRSFLRFLHLRAVTVAPLAQAVPSYSTHREALPEALSADEMARLLGSCDRQTGRGRRDYAVLVVLSRLGLRANEVARLCLDDIDWRAGEVVVRNSKGRRQERLPLPSDVGEALVDYLRCGRPETVPTRTVFVRLQAPLVGLSSNGVTWVVYNACARAALPPVGAHRLRHTVATAVLRAGGSLTEVGQLLSHRRPATTAIYAKVDHASLAGLARPWPGSAP
jgi:integrase/recombinase XerD